MAQSFLKKLERRIIQITDQDFEPGLFSLEGLLTALSFVYSIGVELRLWFYKTGIFRQNQLSCKVISLGNIVAGGTGKTPMAVYLAHLLKSLGRHPVVISRGYMGKIKTGVEIVGDGQTVFLDAGTAGDEPYMMAAGKSFPVVVGRDRYQAGLAAVERFNPDVIILDDGFQHVRLKRDLDILLFDHDRPLGNNRMLPAGRLRESLKTAAGRTHAVILTRCPENHGPSPHENRRAQTGHDAIKEKQNKIPVFKTFHTPYLAQWISLKGDKGQTLDDLKGKTALLWSGIAQNNSFRATVENLGCRVADHLEFRDHYRYEARDIQLIRNRLAKTNADLLVTTEKDLVKVDRRMEWPCDLAVIGIQIRFEQEERFKAFIKNVCNYSANAEN